MEAIYKDYSIPDPPHQPLYLDIMLSRMKEFSNEFGAIDHVLDVGCGDGNFTCSLKQAGFSMSGIDTSSGGITLASRRYTDILFRVSSAYDDFRSPFGREAPFDAIVSVEVIEHLYSPRTFMKRAHESLRPDGMLIVTTPYWGYLKNVLLSVSGRMDRALTALWEGGHIKHFSSSTLRKLGEQEGFEFKSFDGAGIGLRSLPFLWSGQMMSFRKR